MEKKFPNGSSFHDYLKNMLDRALGVKAWARELLGRNASVQALTGGANNQVYRCIAGQHRIIIKSYRDLLTGVTPSRLVSEVQFLNHAQKYAHNFVPKLISSNSEQGMIAISDLGESISKSIKLAREGDVHEAINFYQSINASSMAIDSYPLRAREGYRSVTEHLSNVDSRIDNLRISHVPSSISARSEGCINRLKRDWNSTKDKIYAQLCNGRVPNTLRADQFQLSPGDFGFHNAVRIPHGLKFFDFEYAGLDDPAKTLADFFLQPRVKVSNKNLELAILRFAIKIPKVLLENRVHLMGQLLAIKWRAIILSPLDPNRMPHFTELFGDRIAEELDRRICLSEKIEWRAK